MFTDIVGYTALKCKGMKECRGGNAETAIDMSLIKSWTS